MNSLLNGVSMGMVEGVVEGASAPGGIWMATKNRGEGGGKKERYEGMKWMSWMNYGIRNKSIENYCTYKFET